MPWTAPATRSAGYDVTAANWNELVNDLLFLREVGYAEITAAASTTATTVGTAVQILTLGAITYENAPHMIEVYIPRVSPAAAQTFIILRDGTTVIGTLGSISASASGLPLLMRRRLTPSAASHSYNVAAWLSAAGTTSFSAGSGGTAGDGTSYLPAYIRAERLPT